MSNTRLAGNADIGNLTNNSYILIVPFPDENGKMARLWHTVILSKWKPIFEYIPIESQIEKFHEEYYEAIARCHAAGNLPFLSNSCYPLPFLRMQTGSAAFFRRPCLSSPYLIKNPSFSSTFAALSAAIT